MPTIRTVFQPGVDVEVDETEAANLRAQGLLFEPAPEAVPAAPARNKTPKPEPVTESAQAAADAGHDKEGK